VLNTFRFAWMAGERARFWCVGLSIMKKIIAVVILAVFAAGFFGLMVPRHVLNTLGLARADCDRQNC
jgi:uncharacterized membrane protein YraQ (UPF0718 family)